MNSTCGQFLNIAPFKKTVDIGEPVVPLFVLVSSFVSGSQMLFTLPCSASSWSSLWLVLQVNSWSGSMPQSESCPADWFPGPAAVHLLAADRSALLLHLTHTHTHIIISSCSLSHTHNHNVCEYNVCFSSEMFLQTPFVQFTTAKWKIKIVIKNFSSFTWLQVKFYFL